MIRKSASLAILLVTIAVFGCSRTPEQVQADLLSEGLEQLAGHELDGADSTFARLQREFPANLDGRMGAGLVLEGRMLYHDALEIYMLVAAADPTRIDARHAVARMYNRLGWPEYAAKSLQEASSLPDSRSQTLALLASSLIDVWDLEGAGAILDSPISNGLDPVDANILKASLAYARSGKSELQPVDLDQASSFTLNLLADYCEKRGMIDSAVMVGRQAVEAAGNRFYDLHTQFSRLVRHNYLDDAWAIIEMADGMDKSGSLPDAMRMRYGRAAGDPNLATRASGRYMRVYGDRISGLFYDIESMWMLSNLVACQDNTIMIFNRLRDSTESDEFDDFIEGEIEFVTHMFGTIPGVGDAIPGLAGYKRSEPRFVTAYARMMQRFGGDEISRGMVDSLFAEHQDDPIWLKGLGDVYIEGKGNIEKASRYYAAALEQLPSYRPALVSWLDLLETLREYGKAIELCDRFSELVNANPLLSIRKAEYLAREGNIDQANDIFRSNIQHLKGRTATVQMMAELNFIHGHDAAAWDLVDHSLSVNPGSPSAYYLFADLAFLHDDQERLAEYIGTGLEVDPRSIPLRALKARTLCAEGKLDAATAIFDEIDKDKDLRPEYAYSKIHHSRCLADVPMEQQRGENLARSAVTLDGASERSLVNLAHVYYQYGRYDLARGQARRACSAYPNNAEAFFLLGMSYYKTDHPDARMGLERALELGLVGDRLAKARETLEKL